MVVAVLAAPASARTGPALSVSFVFRDHPQAAVPPVGFSIAPQDDSMNVPVGGSVIFANRGNLPHQPEEMQGLVTWGSVDPGARAQVRPFAAGTYTIHDRNDTVLPEERATATFTVRPTFPDFIPCPGEKAERYAFHVTWATEAAPAGLAYQVRAEVAPDGGWRTIWWKRSTTLAKDTFHVWVPAAKVVNGWGSGSFGISFEARLVDAADHSRHTGWAEAYGGGCVIN